MDTKTVLITGASSGIGYASALKFARAGFQVAGTARYLNRLDDLADEIERVTGQSSLFLPIEADVKSAEAMVRCVETVVDHFGHLHVVAANAGVGHRGGVVDSDWQDIVSLIETNIHGVLHTVRASVPVMNAGGHIVIVSSVAYNTLSPYAASYAASKAFVSSLAQSLRLELEPKQIAVTDLLIGRVDTAFSANRLGKSGRAGSFPPAMPVDRAAEAVFQASQSKGGRVAVRWVDRLILAANLLVPNFVGRKALKRYK